MLYIDKKRPYMDLWHRTKDKLFFFTFDGSQRVSPYMGFIKHLNARFFALALFKVRIHIGYHYT